MMLFYKHGDKPYKLEDFLNGSVSISFFKENMQYDVHQIHSTTVH
jgi:hypothetical protein